MRNFGTGATRNDDTEALDFEGFLSPLSLKAYAEYMHGHRTQKDGSLRDSDNWQKGIPLDSYIKSGFRHMFDWWIEHRTGSGSRDGLKDAICAVIFNASGYLHELVKKEAKVEKSTERTVANNLDAVRCCNCYKVFQGGETIYFRDGIDGKLYWHISCPVREVIKSKEAHA